MKLWSSQGRSGNSSNGVSNVLWLKEGASPEKELGNVDVFINLAGISINNGRWTLKHQEQIITAAWLRRMSY